MRRMSPGLPSGRVISSALLVLPGRLRNAGLTVVEMPDWRTRDNGPGFAPFGIIDHHDGMGIDGDNVPRNMIRPGQYGAQIWLRRNGWVYMLAAGYMAHAGRHNAWGDFAASAGNRQAVGIETDYAGAGLWPLPLLATWRVVHLELAIALGMPADRVGRRLAGHKEIAPDRKPDPANYSMPAARLDLTMDLVTPPPALPSRPAPLPAPIRDEFLMGLSQYQQEETHNATVDINNRTTEMSKKLDALVQVLHVQSADPRFNGLPYPKATHDAVGALIGMVGGLTLKAGKVDVTELARQLKASLSADIVSELARKLGAA